MRQTAVKSTRRQLRKALGSEVAEVVSSLAQNDDVHGNNLAYLRDRLVSLDAQMDGMHDSLLALNNLRAADHAAFVNRGFWSRVRWLVLGS